MRIAFLLTSSLEYPYGLGRCFPIAKELVKLDHEVKILALHPSFATVHPRSFTLSGVRITYVGQMHVREVGDQRLYFPSPVVVWIAALSTLRFTLNALNSKTDLFHLGKPQPINGMAALIAAKFLRRKPLYLDCDDYEAESNRVSGNWQKRVLALFEDGLPRYTQGLTVNTRFLKERIIGLGYPRERIIRVPNGIDRDRFAGLDPEYVSQLKSSLGLENRKVIVYLGSISLASHPLRLLLEAFARVSERLRAARLILVGGGEDVETLRDMIPQIGLEGKAFLLGRVEPELTPYYLAMGDVSVDPVMDDLVARARSPLKIFESMAVGVPVVTGDVGDRSEYLGNGQAGILVKPGDAQALADGLIDVLAEEDRAYAMAQAALERRERYYWDVLVRDFRKIYDL